MWKITTEVAVQMIVPRRHRSMDAIGRRGQVGHLRIPVPAGAVLCSGIFGRLPWLVGRKRELPVAIAADVR